MFFDLLQKTLDQADTWAASDNARVDAGRAAITGAAALPGGVTFVGLDPKSWPTGWRQYSPGYSVSCTLQWGASDAPLAASIGGFVRQIEDWIAKNRSTDAINALLILYAQVSCLENLDVVLRESATAVSAARQFITEHSGANVCLMCRTNKSQLAECEVIIGYRIPPKMVDVFDRVGSLGLGIQYNAPKVAVYEDVVKKTFKGIAGETREALFRDFETTFIPVRIATGVLVASLPTNVQVCRFCGCQPYISFPRSSTPSLEKAFALGDGLWAIPRQKFERGIPQGTVPGFPEAELRVFGRPDPTE
jgi:hypothetical protein